VVATLINNEILLAEGLRHTLLHALMHYTLVLSSNNFSIFKYEFKENFTNVTEWL
jgi:hypothetical protein